VVAVLVQMLSDVSLLQLTSSFTFQLVVARLDLLTVLHEIRVWRSLPWRPLLGAFLFSGSLGSFAWLKAQRDELLTQLPLALQKIAD
jgi:hypothetical protein